jgi:hypothetical protein
VVRSGILGRDAAEQVAHPSDAIKAGRYEDENLGRRGRGVRCRAAAGIPKEMVLDTTSALVLGGADQVGQL